MYREIIGYMNSNELTIIENLAKTVKPDGLIVEVGSFMGKSTCCWASNCHPSVTILAVDEFFDEVVLYYDPVEKKQKLLNPNEDGYELIKNKDPIRDVSNSDLYTPYLHKPYKIYNEFLYNISNYKNIKHIRARSPYEVNFNKEIIDIFFLDADHTNPEDWNNIKFYAQFVKLGGLICGHDYNYIDVAKNIKCLEKIYNTKAVKYDNGTLWSITVTKEFTNVAEFYYE